MPRSHYHVQLSNFQWDGIRPASLQSRLADFYRGAVDGQAPHMLLTGSPGVGKSHLGLGMYRAVSAALGTELATWLNVPAFCEDVKRSYQGTHDPWVEYEQARRLVVLDDLFGREWTAHEKDQIITRLIDTAYTSGAAVMLTMNPPVEELMQRLPAHEISRVLADCTIIPMISSKDYRR